MSQDHNRSVTMCWNQYFILVNTLMTRVSSGICAFIWVTLAPLVSKCTRMMVRNIVLTCKGDKTLFNLNSELVYLNKNNTVTLHEIQNLCWTHNTGFMLQCNHTHIIPLKYEQCGFLRQWQETGVKVEGGSPGTVTLTLLSHTGKLTEQTSNVSWG